MLEFAIQTKLPTVGFLSFIGVAGNSAFDFRLPLILVSPLPRMDAAAGFRLPGFLFRVQFGLPPEWWSAPVPRVGVTNV